MPYFKDQQNNVHFIESVSFSHYLPLGSIPITEEEADQLNSQKSSIVSVYEAELDKFLDSVARSHRYNDRFTFAIRAAYPGPWQAEGLAFAQWMDTCNAQAYQMLLDVQEGRLQQPTVEEFLNSLPDFEP